MVDIVFVLGATVGVVLLTLLLVSIAAPEWRIWPTPGDGSWQGYVFWPLFRSLNVLCFVSAALDHGTLLGLPAWVRALAVLVLAASIGVFVYSFRVLGRDASYCAADGLVTGGIYQWSRNPQNAMLCVVYAALLVAADGVKTSVLCLCMIGTYYVMVLAEEPWLERIYGEAYRQYCRNVPRFFHWRRLARRRDARA